MQPAAKRPKKSKDEDEDQGPVGSSTAIIDVVLPPGKKFTVEDAVKAALNCREEWLGPFGSMATASSTAPSALPSYLQAFSTAATKKQASKKPRGKEQIAADLEETAFVRGFPLQLLDALLPAPILTQLMAGPTPYSIILDGAGDKSAFLSAFAYRLTNWVDPSRVLEFRCSASGGGAGSRGAGGGGDSILKASSMRTILKAAGLLPASSSSAAGGGSAIGGRGAKETMTLAEAAILAEQSEEAASLGGRKFLILHSLDKLLARDSEASSLLLAAAEISASTFGRRGFFSDRSTSSFSIIASTDDNQVLSLSLDERHRAALGLIFYSCPTYALAPPRETVDIGAAKAAASASTSSSSSSSAAADDADAAAADLGLVNRDNTQSVAEAIAIMPDVKTTLLRIICQYSGGSGGAGGGADVDDDDEHDDPASLDDDGDDDDEGGAAGAGAGGAGKGKRGKGPKKGADNDKDDSTGVPIDYNALFAAASSYGIVSNSQVLSAMLRSLAELNLLVFSASSHVALTIGAKRLRKALAIAGQINERRRQKEERQREQAAALIEARALADGDGGGGGAGDGEE